MKRRGIESSWECDEGDSCELWARHREFGRAHDTFVSYAALDDNIASLRRAGLPAFVDGQREREQLLVEMLSEFNEGRSKSYYCVAATVLASSQLRAALASARESSGGMEARDRARALHAWLDAAADARSVTLALRK